MSIHPGQTVTIGAPLNPHDLNPHLGQVIRLRRYPWGDGADITRSHGDTSSGWSPTWVPLDQLHPVDTPTYQQWQTHRGATLAKLRATTTPATSTWEQRQEVRALDRAALVTAAHEVLTERWRRNGILDAPEPTQPVEAQEPQTDDLDAPALFDVA